MSVATFREQLCDGILSDRTLETRRRLYGPNVQAMAPVPWWSTVRSKFPWALWAWQFFEISLWIWDEYYPYAIVLSLQLFAGFLAEVISVM